MLPNTGPFGPSLTGLFRSTWHPKKAVTVLWRRVETLSPAAYDELMDWARARAAAGGSLRWLEAMATNEVAIDVGETLAEIQRLLQARPPEPIRAWAQLLWDLIWEASEPANDWLNWRPCRVCGRRWAVSVYEGVALCPSHRNPLDLIDFLRREMEVYPGLVDHSAAVDALEARQNHVAPPAAPEAVHDDEPAVARVVVSSATVAAVAEPTAAVGVGSDGANEARGAP